MTAASPTVVTFGETMALLHTHDVGSLAHDASLDLSIGGAESNVAIALARLGTAVTWFGRVGDDGLGVRVLRELRAEGVDVRGVLDPQAPTGLMVKERRTISTTSVLYYRAGSAGSRLSPDDIDPDAVRAAAILHVTGITPALSSTAAAAVDAAIDIARAAKVPVSYDVNHRTKLWPADVAAQVHRRIAARADILFAGEEEAELLIPGVRDPEALRDLGPTELIVKRGAGGCSAVIDGVRYDVPALHVPVVDTVGAGDAFVAGYLAERILHRSPAVRLATATAAGAFACTARGDWEGSPTRNELNRFGQAEDTRR